MKLDKRYVEKPWGRTELPPAFGATSGRRVGEIWLVGDADAPLLAKYLFTSERLSVQVHPDDAQAKARGLRCGKSECWYIMQADAGATIGIGLRRELSERELRSAALDGTIVDLMEWRPVAAGDFIRVPPGTIHAIGGGISLLEFQQNSDVTYRLYDYGRPRELHLDDGLAVAQRAPAAAELFVHLDGNEDRVLVDGPHFTLVHTTQDWLAERQRWILPIEGQVHYGPEMAGVGECLLLGPGERLDQCSGRMLIGAAV